MKNDSITVDDEQVRKMFAELLNKDRKKVFKNAARGALNILKKNAITYLKSAVDPSVINKKDKYGNTLRKGIKIRTYKSGKGGLIHILGNYKLKFFEEGTLDRYNQTWRGRPLRKSRYTGKIQASYFFTKARTTSEALVFQSIESLLVKSIQKINNKYKGK